MGKINFKSMFIADTPEHLFIQIDWAQIEAFLVAYLSQDQDMIGIMERGEDIHAIAASAIYGFDITTLPNYKDSKERKVGKEANHSSNYGLGAVTFMENLAKKGVYITLAEARTALAQRHARFPGVKRYHKEIEDTVIQTQKLITPHGRIRHFLDPVYLYKDGIPKLNMRMMRQAYNYIPQTITGDMTNEAWRELETEGLNVRVQCHDSTVLHEHRENLEEALVKIHKVYNGISVKIHNRELKIGYDIKVGYCLGKLVPVKEYLKAA